MLVHVFFDMFLVDGVIRWIEGLGISLTWNNHLDLPLIAQHEAVLTVGVCSNRQNVPEEDLYYCTKKTDVEPDYDEPDSDAEDSDYVNEKASEEEIKS